MKGLLLFVGASIICLGQARSIYIAQTSAGSANGTSCANAYALSFFNTSGNWGSGAGQIGSGTTVYLCGTFTASAGASSYLQFQGSGTSGHPITLTPSVGATLTATYWSGPAIDIAGASWVVVNGAGIGTIQATANGTSLANQQDNGIGIGDSAGGSNNIIEDWVIQNIYVHVCTDPTLVTCTDEGGQDTYGIRVIGGSNNTITGNTVHDAKWTIGYGYGAATTGVVISYNAVSDMDHGIFFGDSTTNQSGVASIFGNDFSNMANWDDAMDLNHHDGLHAWANNSGSSYTVYVYNNYAHGNGGVDFNSWLGTELASTNSFIFNNVINHQSNCTGGTGLIGLWSSPGSIDATIVNNTISGNGPSDGCTGIGIQEGQGGNVVKNNIVENVQTFIYIPTTGQIAASGINNNLWYNSTDQFWCPSNVDVTFATWQSNCGYDSVGLNTNPILGASFVPNTGSPALAAGTNLTGLSVAALDSDKNGVPRPSSGAWTMGAYQGTGSSPPTNLNIAAVTPEQVIVQYTAPSTSACTLAVSSSGLLSDTVYDVSNTEFSGANSDLSRTTTTVPLTGTVVSGFQRWVEIGHRTTAVGSSSGLLRSLALQANTNYTLTVTCGSAASINFLTSNIPVGNMSPDPAGYNANGFRGYDWPATNWTTKAQVLTDPKTGLSLEPASWFGDMDFQDFTQAFAAYYQASGSWTNTANILNGAAGPFATSTTTDPIFVSINPAETNLSRSSNFVGYSISDLRANLSGNGSGSAVSVSVCLSQDSGQTCLSATQTVTIPASTGTICYPTCGTQTSGTQMSPPWSEWSLTKFPLHNLVQPWTAQVSVSGSTVTLTSPIPFGQGLSNGYGLFPQELPVGSKIKIAGSSCTNNLCTIASVTNSQKLTIVESIGTLTNVAATGANFGFKIWKTIGGGTLNLSITYDVLFEDTPGFLISDGASDQCSPNAVTFTYNSAGSVVSSYPANLCVLDFTQGHVVYGFNPATGDWWPIGVPYTKSSGIFGNDTKPTLPNGPWDQTSGNILYGIGFDAASQPQIVKFTYRGSGKPYRTGGLPLSGGGNIWNTVPNGNNASDVTCIGSEQTSGNMCASLLTSTASCPGAGCTNLRTALTQDALYNAGGISFNPSASNGIVGNNFFIAWPSNGSGGGQDAPNALTYTNLSTGATGLTVDTMYLTASSTASQTSTAGCCGGLHTASQWVVGGRYHASIENALGGKNIGSWSGPIEVPVTQVCLAVDGTGHCTNWTATTTITSGQTLPCPAGVCGSSAVANALFIRTSGIPCNPNAASAEITLHNCPWATSTKSALHIAGVGDTFGDTTLAPPLAQSEALNVLAKGTDGFSGTNDVSWWLLRGANGTTAMAHPNAGWQVALLPTFGNESATWWHDSQTGNIIASGQGSAHVDWGVGPSASGATFNFMGGSPIVALYASPANPAGLTNPQYSVGGYGSWMFMQGNSASGSQPAYPSVGSVGWQGNGRVESYPSCRQQIAPDTEKVWCGDYNAYQGGAFVSNGVGTSQDSISLTSVSTGGRTHVWSTPGPGTAAFVNPKLIAPDIWAGGFVGKDVSSPTANSFTDSSNGGTAGSCTAYKVNECVTGSTVNTTYINWPQSIITGTVWTNNIEVAAPAPMPASPIAPWSVQHDITKNTSWDIYYRKLTLCGNSPSRAYNAANWRPLPPGGWGLCLSTFADGVTPEMYLMGLPSWPGYDSYRRDNFILSTFTVSGGAALAEVRFGYEENGALGNFFCTTRQETCASHTAANYSQTSPFVWIGVNGTGTMSDGHDGTSCSSGCQISIPVLAARMAWYQIFKSYDGGTTWIGQGQPMPMSR